ncbi:hypothetical protein Vi05172_g4226 [Venturia inaequalis]|nr:hypothetical protein Vi05172_g4226 [Venturia inaequalis]
MNNARVHLPYLFLIYLPAPDSRRRTPPAFMHRVPLTVQTVTIADNWSNWTHEQVYTYTNREDGKEGITAFLDMRWHEQHCKSIQGPFHPSFHRENRIEVTSSARLLSLTRNHPSTISLVSLGMDERWWLVRELLLP